MFRPCRQRRRVKPNREREDKNEDALRPWSARLPRAYFRARIRLAFGSAPRLLRTPCYLSQGHHHSVWFSFHADSGVPLCLGLSAGLRATKRKLPDARI